MTLKNAFDTAYLFKNLFYRNIKIYEKAFPRGDDWHLSPTCLSLKSTFPKKIGMKSVVGPSSLFFTKHADYENEKCLKIKVYIYISLSKLQMDTLF